MAQTQTITCDASGCRKTLGTSNDRITVVANQVIATNDNDGVPVSVLSGDYDFCSWEHAGAFFTELAGEAGERRAAFIEERAPAEEPTDG